MTPIPRLTPLLFVAVAILTACAATIAIADEPRIKNADFSEWDKTKPAGWIVRNNKQQLSQATETDHQTVDTALQVDIVKNGGGSYGEILQKLQLEQGTRYRISGDLRSTEKGIAFFQVKAIRSKKELERIASKSSDTEWKTVSTDFDTAGADEVQILCRYRQKAENVGATAWWTNLTIEVLGEGTPPRDPMSLEIAPVGRTLYVTPDGAGAKDGTDWENARSAHDDLQAALDSVGPGQTLYFGSGVYPNVSLTLAAGGTSDEARVTIQGVDTGEGLPRFVSSFDKDNPDADGSTLLTVAPYVGFVTIQNLRVEKHKQGIIMYGPNRGLRITDLDATESREGIVVNAGAMARLPDSGTHDLVIRDCDFHLYTKRAIRLRGGVYDVLIENCHADAGGQPWATERFAMGFTVEGAKAEGVQDKNITYTGCTSRNHYDDNGKGYWNADGFAAERGTSDITYRNCGAFDNTDGGWDIKCNNPRLINCVALRNKRNYRIWSHADAPANIFNCVAAYSEHRGGSGNRNGFHLTKGAGVIAQYCTLAENGQAIDIDASGETQTFALFTHSLIYEPSGPASTSDLDDVTTTFENCIVIDSERNTGDPGFVDARPSWEGGDNAFDSKPFPDIGYHFGRHQPER